MILLSFDIEEFDMPFEYGKDISIENQIAVSEKGTEIILNLLQKHQIKATLFSFMACIKLLNLSVMASPEFLLTYLGKLYAVLLFKGVNSQG